MNEEKLSFVISAEKVSKVLSYLIDTDYGHIYLESRFTKLDVDYGIIGIIQDLCST